MDSRRRRRLQLLDESNMRLDREIEELQQNIASPQKNKAHSLTDRALDSNSREKHSSGERSPSSRTPPSRKLASECDHRVLLSSTKSATRHPVISFSAVPLEIRAAPSSTTTPGSRSSSSHISSLSLAPRTSVPPLSKRKRLEFQDSDDSGTDSDEEEFLRKLGVALPIQTSTTTKEVPTAEPPTGNDKEDIHFPRGAKRSNLKSHSRTSMLCSIEEGNEVNAGGRQENSENELEASHRDKEPKPNFLTPKFPPTEYEPYRLGTTQDGHGVEMIPAPIARYLPDFQKKGVKFVYQAIIKEGGACLGDDMGCGKTVQMAALLASLFGKTGTIEDQNLNENRIELARRWKVEDERLKAEALRNGHVLESQKHSLPDFPLSKWVPVLIIVPNSVVPNWTRDLDTWGYFSVAAPDRKSPLASIWENEILIIKHSWLEDEQYVKSFLSLIPWKIVIIDEYHRFKNPKGRKTQMLSFIRDSTKAKMIGLTGTPMQNNHKELHTLFNLIVKDFFRPFNLFAKEFATPIREGMSKHATSDEERLSREKRSQLRTILSRVYIRRTKEQVLRNILPQKDERVVLCELSNLQKRLYQHILQSSDFLLLKFARTPCDCGVNNKFFLEYQRLATPSEKLAYHRRHKKQIRSRAECCGKYPKEKLSGKIDRTAVLWVTNKDHCLSGDEVVGCKSCPYCVLFSAMSILEKVSSHASLLQAPPAVASLMTSEGEIDHAFSSSLMSSEKFRELQHKLTIAKAFIPQDCLEYFSGGYVRQPNILNQHFDLSGKCKVLHRLLVQIQRRNGRVLLFSYSTETLTLLENMLSSQGMTYLRMDGKTNDRERENLANRFQKDREVFVFLLSTKAMGVGLNLQAANNVVIFDCDWNPANDSQAQDRAYRIGQSKDVTVYRLIAMGTIEEQKYLRTIYKTQLKDKTMNEAGAESQGDNTGIFRGVADDDMRRGELFGIQNLLKFKDGPFMNYQGLAKKGKGDYFDGIVSSDNIAGMLENMIEEEVFDIGSGIGEPTGKPGAVSDFYDLDVSGKDDKDPARKDSSREKSGLLDNLDGHMLEEDNELWSIGGESQAVMEMADDVVVTVDTVSSPADHPAVVDGSGPRTEVDPTGAVKFHSSTRPAEAPIPSFIESWPNSREAGGGPLKNNLKQQQNLSLFDTTTDEVVQRSKQEESFAEMKFYVPKKKKRKKK